MTATESADLQLKWTELENSYLDNRPGIWTGRGRGRKYEPDEEAEITEAWLFTYLCQRTKRGVKRRRALVTLKAANTEELNKSIEAFVSKPDVILIESVADPYRYVSSKREPVRMVP